VPAIRSATVAHAELVVAHTSSGAEELAKMIPKARVVAAFNTVPSEVLFDVYRPKRKARRPSLVYCGDDQGAKEFRGANPRRGFRSGGIGAHVFLLPCSDFSPARSAALVPSWCRSWATLVLIALMRRMQRLTNVPALGMIIVGGGPRLVNLLTMLRRFPASPSSEFGGKGNGCFS
jgi:hypothetical protein